jgi:hypothetical protein
MYRKRAVLGKAFQISNIVYYLIFLHGMLEVKGTFSIEKLAK